MAERALRGRRTIRPSEPALSAPARQEQAVERSLSGARARSTKQVERLVEAARSLVEETGRPAFTVQQVLTRSGMSIKTFYRYFAGKDDLLLAVFEAVNRQGATHLQRIIDAHEDPVERVHVCITGLFHLTEQAGDAGSRAVFVREHYRLAESQPAALSQALAPFLDVIEAELAAAMAAGALRAGDPRRDASTVFQLVLSYIQPLALGHLRGDVAEVAEYIWQFCRAGLSPAGLLPDQGGRP